MKGHDFSRAANATKRREGFSPEGCFLIGPQDLYDLDAPKTHRGCPRSLAFGDRGDSGPQLAGIRSSGIGPGKRRSIPHFPTSAWS